MVFSHVSAEFINRWQYHGKDTRQRHSYYRTDIVKSCIVYQTVLLPMTFSNPEGYYCYCKPY